MLIPASSRRRSPGRRHGEDWPSGPEPRVRKARRRSRRKRRCSARSRVRCPGWRGCWGDVLASPAAQPRAVLRGGDSTSARVEHGPGPAAAFGGHRRFLSGANPRTGPRVAAADRPSQRPSGTRRTAGVAGASPPELRAAAGRRHASQRLRDEGKPTGLAPPAKRGLGFLLLQPCMVRFLGTAAPCGLELGPDKGQAPGKTAPARRLGMSCWGIVILLVD
jgi:hypothetical protein